MIALYILTAVSSIITSYIFNKNISYNKMRLSQRIMGTICVFIGTSLFLMMPFLMVSIDSILNTILIPLLLISNSAAAFIFHDGNNKKSIKILFTPIMYIYLFVYIPFLTIYYFRYLPLGKEILAVSIVFLFYIALIVVLKLTKVHKWPNYFLYLIITCLAVFGSIFIIVSTPAFTTDNNQKRSLDPFSDYYSENLISVEDGTLNGELEDYYFDDTFIYYLVTEDYHHISFFKPSQYTFKVYDYKQSIEVFSYTYEDVNPAKKVFTYTDSTLYCFLDNALYTYSNNELTKITNHYTNNIDSFTYHGEEYFLHNNKELDLKSYYKLTDTFTQTTIFDSIENLSIRNNQLIIKTSNEIELVGSPNNTTYPISEYDLITFSDTKALYYVNDSLSETDEYEYKVIDYLGNESTIYNSNSIQNSDVREYNGLYYFSDQAFAHSSTNLAFVDEDYNVVASYDFTMINQHDSEYTKSSLKEINDSLVYARQTSPNNSNQKLYFEINQLKIQESKGLLDKVDNLTIETYVYIYVGSITILIMIMSTCLWPSKREE